MHFFVFLCCGLKPPITVGLHCAPLRHHDVFCEHFLGFMQPVCWILLCFRGVWPTVGCPKNCPILVTTKNIMRIVSSSGQVAMARHGNACDTPRVAREHPGNCWRKLRTAGCHRLMRSGKVGEKMSSSSHENGHTLWYLCLAHVQTLSDKASDTASRVLSDVRQMF